MTWERHRRRGRHIWAAALALCAALSSSAQSPLLDDVAVQIEGSSAKVRIRFNVPVRYLRHFPADRGELLQIFFRVITIDGADINLREEMRRVRPTAGLPGFSVTYQSSPSRDVRREPLSLLVQFDRPVSFTVTEGRDKRSIYLAVPITPVDR